MAIYIAPSLVSNPALSDQPLNHARILYSSVLTASNISGAETSGFPLASIISPATYSRWQPAFPDTLTTTGAIAQAVDCVGIAGHTLAGRCLGVSLSSSTNGSTWTNIISTGAITSNDPVMLLFPITSARWWRISFDLTDNAQIAHIKLGKALAMQREIYGGHAPINLSRATQVRRTVSEGGEWLGATTRPSRLVGEAQWRHLSPSWYRANFQPFAESIPQANPFFFAWRPQGYPDGTAYAWATEDIRPSNMGVRDFMQVQLSMEGYVGE